MSGLKTRASQWSLDRVLGVASAVLLPFGLAVIVLGWYGAAHTPYLFEQVPYLISGGLLGLGLVMGAGLLYLGSWVARGAAAQQRATGEMAAVLREIRDELGHGAGASLNGGGRVAGRFVATARGSMWHRPDCAVVAGRTDLRTVGPDGGGLQACALCDPLSAVPTHV